MLADSPLILLRPSHLHAYDGVCLDLLRRKGPGCMIGFVSAPVCSTSFRLRAAQRVAYPLQLWPLGSFYVGRVYPRHAQDSPTSLTHIR